MREERLEVSVTFDERHGYIGSAPELRQPMVALPLGGLRRRIEVARDQWDPGRMTDRADSDDHRERWHDERRRHPKAADEPQHP